VESTNPIASRKKVSELAHRILDFVLCAIVQRVIRGAHVGESPG
jgi:hypothetical protein